MIVTLILFFFFGIAVGSFLNVVADRLPEGKSLISPPSHCPSCKAKIARKDLIPIFSYLWLKGRCRSCNVKIPLRSLIVEITTGLLFVFYYWHFGLNYELLIVIIYTAFFIVLFITDLEQGILPNKIVYAGMLAAILLAAAGTLFGFEPGYASGMIFRLSKFWILNAFLGGAVGFVILFVVALASRGGMGGGDIKLAGFLGLIVGFPLILVLIFIAVVVGGLVSAILLILKIRERKQAIPFGPFLVFAVCICLVWGNNLVNWYVSASRLPIQ
jgi:leader peptidase (prepilin peptidase) / N-methyltransferase